MDETTIQIASSEKNKQFVREVFYSDISGSRVEFEILECNIPDRKRKDERMYFGMYMAMATAPILTITKGLEHLVLQLNHIDREGYTAERVCRYFCPAEYYRRVEGIFRKIYGRGIE